MFQLIQGLKILEKHVQHNTFWHHSDSRLAVHNITVELLSAYDYETLITLGWVYFNGTWYLTDARY